MHFGDTEAVRNVYVAYECDGVVVERGYAIVEAIWCLVRGRQGCGEGWWVSELWKLVEDLFVGYRFRACPFGLRFICGRLVREAELKVLCLSEEWVVVSKAGYTSIRIDCPPLRTMV